jgi:hypothetical protein
MQVPYIPSWKNDPQSQTHCTEKSILLVSGCSFTASGRLDTCASTWPGLLKQRCGMLQAFDYSFPGVGNEYIAESILHHVSDINDQDAEKTLVVVMWSGLNRFLKKVPGPRPVDQGPFLKEHFYCRNDNPMEILSDNKLKALGAQQSADKIFQVAKHLISKNISFAFSFYCNLLYPPYIPKPDLSHEFDNYVDSTTLANLKKLPIIPRNPMDFMFEYGFAHDQLADDGFHPTHNCIVAWTNNVLLPGLVDLGLINPI